QAALEVRPDHAGRRLRPQHQPGAALTVAVAVRLDPVQLLAGDVRVAADAALDQLHALDDRELDLLVAVRAGLLPRGVLDDRERRPLGGQDVADAAGSLDGSCRWHARSLRM